MRSTAAWVLVWAGWALGLGLRAEEAPSAPAPVLQARSCVLKVVAPLALNPLRNQVGSGVLVAQGLVATSAHVVVGSEAVRVEQEGQAWPARLRALDLHRDIALLEVEGRLPAPALPAPSDPWEGERVFSWSFPGGQGPSLTMGALGFTWAYEGHWMLQAELQVARGSSGGGLFNAEGRLLGLTTFVLDSSPHSVFVVPVAWVLDLARRPEVRVEGEAHRKTLLEGFLETLGRDPENAVRWHRFTEAWVKQAPGDAEAWSAHARALMALASVQGAGGATGERLEREARIALERALAADRRRAVDWHNLGVSLDREDRYLEAAAAFRESLALREDHGPTWAALGSTLFNARDFQGACVAAQQAVQRTPDEPAAWSLLAYTERALKRWSEARDHARVALRYAPHRADWWLLLGECAQRAQDGPAVEEALGRLRDLDPAAARELSRLVKRRP